MDDEYMMRGVLTEILQESGFAVTAASPGEEAVQSLAPGRQAMSLKPPSAGRSKG
jgi:CheY-like chemotaxis protein